MAMNSNQLASVRSEPGVSCRCKSAARAEGVLLPAKPTDFLDIDVRFDNIQIPPLSPYSATFAGRKIDSGKLWLTLHYKIVNQQLAGENKILLEDFKLIHRALDVKKVQAEVRHAELENIRLAARALKGKDEDPDIEKKIVVEGAPAAVIPGD